MTPQSTFMIIVHGTRERSPKPSAGTQRARIVGITELIVVMVVALILIPPEKLPEVMRTVGKILRDRDMKQICDPGAAYDGLPDRAAVVGHESPGGWELRPVGEDIRPRAARRGIAHENVPTEILKIGRDAVSRDVVR